MAKPSIGKVVWFEIFVSDVERAKVFYGELFNWKFAPFEDFQKGYWVIDTGQEDLSGGFVHKTAVEPAVSLSSVLYFSVEDISGVLAKAERMGARIVRPKTLITQQAGFFAHLKDLDGNLVAIWSQV